MRRARSSRSVVPRCCIWCVHNASKHRCDYAKKKPLGRACSICEGTRYEAECISGFKSGKRSTRNPAAIYKPPKLDLDFEEESAPVTNYDYEQDLESGPSSIHTTPLPSQGSTRTNIGLLQEGDVAGNAEWTDTESSASSIIHSASPEPSRFLQLLPDDINDWTITSREEFCKWLIASVSNKPRCYWPYCTRKFGTHEHENAGIIHVMERHLGVSELASDPQSQIQQLTRSDFQIFERTFGYVELIFERMRSEEIVVGNIWLGEMISVCDEVKLKKDMPAILRWAAENYDSRYPRPTGQWLKRQVL